MMDPNRNVLTNQGDAAGVAWGPRLDGGMDTMDPLAEPRQDAAEVSPEDSQELPRDDDAPPQGPTLNRGGMPYGMFPATSVGAARKEAKRLDRDQRLSQLAANARARERERERLEAEHKAQELPGRMVLHCSQCGGQHVDTVHMEPHLVHDCEHCSMAFAPFTFPTVGVPRG